MGKRGIALVVTVLVMPSLIGCGHRKSVQDVDTCSLLTKKEVAGYLGKASSKPKHQREKYGVGPSCMWPAEDDASVYVGFEDRADKALPMEKKIKVNGVTGWVFDHLSDASCTIIVDTKPKLVRVAVDTSGLRSEGSAKATCENVAKTAGKIVERLGWKA